MSNFYAIPSLKQIAPYGTPSTTILVGRFRRMVFAISKSDDLVAADYRKYVQQGIIDHIRDVQVPPSWINRTVQVSPSLRSLFSINILAYAQKSEDRYAVRIYDDDRVRRALKAPSDDDRRQAAAAAVVRPNRPVVPRQPRAIVATN